MNPDIATQPCRTLPRASRRLEGSLWAGICRGCWLVVLCSWLLLHPDTRAVGAQTIDWDAEFSALIDGLETKHVDPFTRITRDEWLRLAEGLRDAAPQRSRDQNVAALMQIAAALGDGHTAVSTDPASGNYLPVQFQIFPDGVYIIAAAGDAAESVSARLDSVEEVPSDEVLERLTPVLSHDNPQQLQNLSSRMLSSSDLLRGIGVAPATGPVTLGLTQNGQTRKLQLDPLPHADLRKLDWRTPDFDPAPRYLQKQNLAFWNDWLPDSRTIYFKYNRCDDARGFARLVAGTQGFVQQNQVDRFVLDLRDNGGGNSAIFQPLLEWLQTSDFNQPGRLYVILGRRTFSSAVLNAMALRDTKARFFGEPTGGRPNHFGEIRSFDLPASGLKVHYSTKFFRTMPDSDPPSLEPDVAIPCTAADYFAGRDPVLQAILADQPTGPADRNPE